MCTVTIHRGEKRLLLTMNRDERRTRKMEEPPRLQPLMGSGVSILAPRDTERGGTWIGANNCGMAACILNGYQPADEGHRRDGTHLSRGRLIPAVLHFASARDSLSWISEKLRPSDFPSFTLLIADGKETYIIRWLGHGSLQIEAVREEWFFFSSSSWNQEEVIKYRHQLFHQWIEADHPFAGYLPSIHLQSVKDLREYSPLMSRSSSCTRSITQVALYYGKSSEIHYWPYATPTPCEPDSSMRLAFDPGVRDALMGKGSQLVDQTESPSE